MERDRGIAGDEGKDTDLESRIRRALDHVRPFLMIDGGGVELISIDFESGIVEVSLTGACETCAMSPMTLRAGIERAILREAPEVKRIECASIMK